ncbi:MAG: glutaredoxin family protein [Thermoleophilaceae bacterium]|nr:glutaredoxin family protein [Thermoleophilaceae bacterium]
MRSVTLYGKPGCHLCEEGRAVLAAARARRDFALEEVDVSLEPRLARRYGERVPVVAIDGEDALELRFEAEEVIRALDRVGA